MKETHGGRLVSSRPVNTITPSSTAERAKALGTLIVKFRLTNGWQLLPTADQMAMTAAWLEVLDISGVPAEQYEACYAAAVQARAERRANGEQLSHLTADELAAEWLKIKRLNDELRVEELKHRALCEVNPKSCERCFGTMREEMPGGGVREDCDHTPLSDEERAARDDEKRERLKWLREQAKQIGRPKPAVVERPKVPAGLHYKCDSCRRALNVLRELDGQECGDLLNRGTHDGELKLCRGQFKRATAHECQIESCAKFRKIVMALPGETCPACGEGLEVFEEVSPASELEQ